jgi:hypothetical protein
LATDAFYKPAKIFNELDLFQRDPGWLAAFPDGVDDSVAPRAEIYVGLIRERDRDPSGDDPPLWQIHADQWMVEVDEERTPVPPVAPTEILRLCMSADASSTVMGTETEAGAEEGVWVCYTWSELRLSPTAARELLRALCTRFAQAYPDDGGEP